MQYREAARVLGIPLGTVKSRMHKALQDLHDALLVVRHGKA
jgi:DNA-directed RNA polymerase specialized sigma24 family protein